MRPLVDAADFEAAGRRLQAHTRSSGQGERHRLAGLVFCLDCGAAMVKVSSRYKGETRSYLRCGRYAADRGCGASHAVRLDYLEALVTGRLWELLARWFAPEEAPPEEPDEDEAGALRREAALLKGEIGRRDRALREMYLDKASGLLTAEQFQQMSGDYAREKAAMSEEADPAGGGADAAGSAGEGGTDAGGFRGQGGDAASGYRGLCGEGGGGSAGRRGAAGGADRLEDIKGPPAVRDSRGCVQGSR